MNVKRSFYTVLMLALLTLLVGCPADMPKKAVSFDDGKSSSYYLSQADSSLGFEKTNWQLFALRALVKENKLSQASALLANLPSDLTDAQRKEKLLLQGLIAIKTNQSFSLNGLSPEGLSDTQRFEYYTIKLVLDNQDKDINAQAHDYLALENYAPASKKDQVISSTWQFLNKLSDSEVQAILVYTNETVLQGWIDLLYAYKNNSKSYVASETDTPEMIAANQQEQKNKLKQAMSDWLVQYADHPAKNLVFNLTGEQLSVNSNMDGKKVALFLPLNGGSRVFGETIRQGYFDASHFYPQEPQQNIITLDTTSAPLNTLVEQAQQQGAELIVGPLLKDEVAKIKQLSPATPVLALNKIDGVESDLTANTKMCFFALSPEDEAKDAAKHIYSQHKTKPLILVPQTDLGKRVAESFAKQWQISSSNSSQAYVKYFDDTKTLSANMNRNIGIDLSGQPIEVSGTQISNIDNAEPASEFDAIYVYASYDELTFIKPMLEMKLNQSLNSLSSLTMYTSSKSNIVNASTDYYYDMERVQFAEISMIVNKADLTVAVPDKIQNDYSLMRLYAMGIDAWRLANRFSQLNSNQDNVLDGMTGQLSTENHCEVTRSLIWKQYIHGLAQPIANSQ